MGAKKEGASGVPVLQYARLGPLSPVSNDTVQSVNLDVLVSSRMLIQANSGAGKSRALRSLLEQTHGKLQHFVIDPEGEFSTLRERYDYVLVGGEGSDVPADPATARVLCRRLMDLNASAVLDLYALSLDDRRAFVREFLGELMHLPRDVWRPLLVAIDEAHKFCPEGKLPDYGEAVITLCTQGRKRGYCAVLATQRLSKLNKDAAAELLNVMLGRTGLDVDVARAGDMLGLARDARNSLAFLTPGTFWAYGPAIAQRPVLVRTGEVTTTHPQAGVVQTAAAPQASGKLADVVAALADIRVVAKAEADDVDALRARVAEAEAARNDLLRELAAARKGAPDPVHMRQAVEHAVENAVRAERQRMAADVATALRALNEASMALTAPATLLKAACTTLESTTSPLRPAPAVQDNHRARYLGSPGDVTALEPLVSDVSKPATGEGPTRMLQVLREFLALGLKEVDARTLAVHAGISPNSSNVGKFLRILRTDGLVGGTDRALWLTPDGIRRAPYPERDVTLAQHQARWLSKVSDTQARMLELLLHGKYPGATQQTRERLAAAAGRSPSSSAVDADLRDLKSLGLVEPVVSADGKRWQATRLLYPEGLR